MKISDFYPEGCDDPKMLDEHDVPMPNWVIFESDAIAEGIEFPNEWTCERRPSRREGPFFGESWKEDR